MTSQTTILDGITTPSDLRAVQFENLKNLANELRSETVKIVSKNGGHLGASLGVIELTIALHYCFNTPDDKLIWDIGHQTYPHKILTGRRDKMDTLRKPNGLSGFTNIFENPYDHFGAGHSSTSISAALGFVAGSKVNNKNNEVIAIIGDGAISAGMAYEALNNAAEIGKRLIVILNDNNMSISPPTGAISKYLPRLASSRGYNTLRTIGNTFAENIGVANIFKRAEKSLKHFTLGGNIFEEMGFRYVGPVDGHDLKEMVTIFKNIQNNFDKTTPVLIHVITKKGKGYIPAENSEDKFHGVSSFDINSGIQIKKTNPSTTSFSEVFCDRLCELAASDDKIIAITAAMKSGTGLTKFAKQFPDRFFDVGIAEQHMLTFAAGLALEGLKPFCAIYSTFLQRAYDQLIHDICIQKIPVRFAIDRAGFVGADGPTHNGVFDVGFLRIIPNIVICGASDGYSLRSLLGLSQNYDESAFAVRYQKAETTINTATDHVFNVGRGRVLRNGERVALVGFCSTVVECLKAADIISHKYGFDITVVDAVFAKPIDADLFLRLARTHSKIICVDENSIGGLASILLEFFHKQGYAEKYIYISIPDVFIEQNTTEGFSLSNGFNHANIATIVEKYCNI